MIRNGTYVGVLNDHHGGMTAFGKIVMDGWVFGLIADTETCEGWNRSRFDVLTQQVHNEWDKYGCMVSQLPEELFKRHQEIYAAAMERARDAGWSGETETSDED